MNSTMLTMSNIADATVSDRVVLQNRLLESNSLFIWTDGIVFDLQSFGEKRGPVKNLVSTDRCRLFSNGS